MRARLGDEASELLKQGLKACRPSAQPEFVEQTPPRNFGLPPGGGRQSPLKPLYPFLEHPDTQPVHLVRALYQVHALALVNPHWLHLTPPGSKALEQYRKHHSMDLNQWQRALDDLGAFEHLMMVTIVHGETRYLKWGARQIWPYFAERTGLLEKLLRETIRDERLMMYKIDIVLRVLAMANPFPESLAEALVARALKGRKSEQDRLEPSLARLKDLGRLLIEGLQSRKSGERVAAAHWIARLKVVSAGDALEQALSKEKSQKPKVALEEALQALGRQVKVQKSPVGLPKALSWLSLEEPGLCSVLAQGYELKRLEPWPELKATAAELPKDTASRVLDQWIAHHSKSKPKAGARGLLAVVAATADDSTVQRALEAVAKWGPEQIKASQYLLELAGYLKAVFPLFEVWLENPVPALRQKAHRELSRLTAKREPLMNLVDRHVPRQGDVEQICAKRLDIGRLLGHQWDFDFWRQHLLEHPLMGSLCRDRLWQAGNTAFRPDESGKLLNASGEEVPVKGLVQLAHSSTLGKEEREAWDLPERPRVRAKGSFLKLGFSLSERELWEKTRALGFLRCFGDDDRYYHTLRRTPPLADYHFYLLVPEAVGHPEGERVVTLEKGFFDDQEDGDDPIPLDALPPALLSETLYELNSQLKR